MAYFFFGVEDIQEVTGIQRRMLMHRDIDKRQGNDVSFNKVGDKVFDLRLERLAGAAKIVRIKPRLDLSFPKRQEEHIGGLVCGI